MTMTASTGKRFKRANTPFDTLKKIDKWHEENIRKFRGDEEVARDSMDFTAIKYPKGLTPALVADLIGEGAVPNAVVRRREVIYPGKEFLHQIPRPKPVAIPVATPVAEPEQSRLVPGPSPMKVAEVRSLMVDSLTRQTRIEERQERIEAQNAEMLGILRQLL